MDLAQLQILTEIQFQRSHQGLSELLHRETELRSELSRLRALAKETHSLPPEQAPMRSIGADLIWLKWISQTTRELNIKLAQVLVEKDALMAGHKRAFGKKAVAEQLHKDSMSAKKKAQQDASLKRTIEQFVL